ncbi:uncharacterized protein LOC132199380 isoform X2 [Neocloeon triangulifer]|nr:uncharacterized protein LOC132199380 isoform X2 [Neocloeon triangulifer]
MDNRSHLETPPPSPPINEHQTEARIEYTDAATLRLPVNRGSKRRPASSDLENHTDHTVPPVEFKEPSDLITKAPCRQHSNHDEIELEAIANAIDQVTGDFTPMDHEERSTGESDAHSAGTVSAKSTQRLILKKFEDDEPHGIWYECMIGCCTCLGFFCFT